MRAMFGVDRTWHIRLNSLNTMTVPSFIVSIIMSVSCCCVEIVQMCTKKRRKSPQTLIKHCSCSSDESLKLMQHIVSDGVSISVVGAHICAPA